MFQMITALCGKFRGMNVKQRYKQLIPADDVFILFQVTNRC